MPLILTISESGITGNIPVISAKSVSLVDCPECVVIVGSGADIPALRCAAGVIIDGDSGVRTTAQRLCGVQLITCGRCCMNTVSISSDSGDMLTLALNRTIKTLYGECEPMELPVRRNGSDYRCMAQFAAGIILGTIKETGV